MSCFPRCHVCDDNTTYEKRSGFFVCIKCNTQSQEIREENFEYLSAGNVGEDEEIELTTIEPNEIERKFTSWETYNIILKGVVDEIIDLGAPRDVRIVAFQVWATYLQKAEAAFISTTYEKLPRLPLGFKDSDAKLLYNLKNVNVRGKLYGDFSSKRTRKQKNKFSEDSESGSRLSVSTITHGLRSFRRKQLSLARLECSQSSSSSNISSTTTLDSLVTKTKRDRRKIRFVKSLKNRLKRYKIKSESSNSSADDLDDAEKCNAKARRLNQSCWSYKTFSDKRLINRLNILTMPALVAILQIALYLTSSEIQLGDVLRWILEGRLSFCKPHIFFKPSDFTPARGDQIFLKNCTRKGFLVDLGIITNDLEIKFIPTPNLYKMVKRFCVELQLPDEFVKCIYCLMNMLPPQMNYQYYTKTLFPDYECRVMAFILFAAKLLFSLDDVTEKYHSQIAESVNRFRSNGENRLFSWNKWVKYLECRKANLCRYNMYVDAKYYDKQNATEDTFINHLRIVKGPIEEHQSIDQIFLHSVNSLFSKLLTDDSEDEADHKEQHVDFPSSLTPQYTYLKHLLENHNTLIPIRSIEILKYDFTADSISFLLHNERDDRFDIREDMPETIQIKWHKRTFPLFNRKKSENGVIAAHQFVKISVTKNSDGESSSSHKNHRRRKLRNFNPIVDKLISSMRTSNNSEQPDKPIPFYKPYSYYWTYDICISNSKECYEEELKQYLPSSFMWILKECTSIIGVECKDLYTELLFVETMFYSRLVNKQCKQKKFTGRTWKYRW